jgi:succinoglycan biosynthesis transport protein ExoP
VHHSEIPRVQIANADEQVRLADVVAFLSRRRLIIGSITMIAIALGIWYVMTATPLYTATAKLLVDPEQVRMVSVNSELGAVDIGTPEIESYAEVMRSDAVALVVLNELGIQEGDTGYFLPRSMFQKLVGEARKFLSLNGTEETATYGAQRTLLHNIQRGLDVRRLGESYIIQVAYTAPDPDAAADVANRISNAYIDIDRNSRADAARKGADWFSSRLVELGSDARRAAEAVENYRAVTGILMTGPGSSVDQQQLAETTTQLMNAREDVRRVSAQLEVMEGLIGAGQISDAALASASIGPVLASAPVIELRERLVSTRADEAALVVRFGPESEAVTGVRRILNGIENEIRDELRRIRDSTRADLNSARLRVTRIEHEIEGMMTRAADRSNSHVELAVLESRERTYRTLYETALAQFENTSQRVSFPVSNVRVLAPADSPLTKSHPHAGLVLALSGVVGLFVGLSAGIVTDRLDRHISGPKQLRRELQLPVLGAIPAVPVLTRMRDRNLLNLVVTQPRSPVGAAIRGVRTSLDLTNSDAGARVIVGASLTAKEGKSTILMSLAVLYALDGAKVMLVDANDGGTKLTARLEPILAKVRATIEEMPEEARGAIEITTAQQADTWSGRSSTAVLRAQLPIWREKFDVVLIDTPPLRASSEARAVAQMADAVFFVCAWRRNRLDQLEAAIEDFGVARRRIIGVALNRLPKRSGDA